VGGTTSGTTSAAGNTGAGGGTGAGGTFSSGGSGGSTGVGSSTGATTSYWPSDYKATAGGTQGPPGQSCFGSCHTSNDFAFGGTVYDSTGKGLSSVEIGVKLTSGEFYSAFSGSNGNFYYQKSGVNLAGADIRARDANGEKQMPVTSTSSGDCNGCHDGSGATHLHITAP
jgi:hypothetical protein